MNRTLSLQPVEFPDLRLRSVAAEDAERLRRWKNVNRQHFFFRDEITPEMQARWMSEYLARPLDHMFVVERLGRPVGCLGFRDHLGRGDVYNVILADSSSSRQGIMTAALRTLLTFCRTKSEEIGLVVLKENHARRFYERNGFEIAAESPDHVEMRLNWARFTPVTLA